MMARDRDYDADLNEFEKAKDYCIKSYDTQGYGETIYLQATLLIQGKKYETARNLLDNALIHLWRMQNPYWLCENYYALVKVLYHLNEIDSIKQCLFNICNINISENWEYHCIAVSRTVNFLTYYFIREGKTNVIDLIAYIKKLWESDKKLVKIPLIKFLEDQFANHLTKIYGASYFHRKTLHKLNSSCKSQSMQGVGLVTIDRTKEYKICKKCEKSAK
jgi:hypothetical protein